MAKNSLENEKKLAQEFFENYPNAESVLVVGTNLFLPNQTGAAQAHADLFKEEVKVVHRNSMTSDKSVVEEPVK